MEENTIDQIIEQIFTTSVKQPHTYSIEFDPPPNTNYEQQTQFLFRELCYVLRKGCGHLFPQVIMNDKIEISLLHTKNFLLLNQYFQSFGFVIQYKIIPKTMNLFNNDLLDENYINNLLEDNDYSIDNLPELPKNNLSNEHSNKKELRDYSYRLTDTRRNIDYEIKFDYLT
jgi:hypothetical protein